MHKPYEKREKELVAAAVHIRAHIVKDDEFDWTREIEILNDVLEPYGYMRIKQKD